MLLQIDPQLSSRMPAFAVTEEMRAKVDELVKTTGLTRGEIMRRALSLFFREIANSDSEIANEVSR